MQQARRRAGHGVTRSGIASGARRGRRARPTRRPRSPCRRPESPSYVSTGQPDWSTGAPVRVARRPASTHFAPLPHVICRFWRAVAGQSWKWRPFSARVSVERAAHATVSGAWSESGWLPAPWTAPPVVPLYGFATALVMPALNWPTSLASRPGRGRRRSSRTTRPSVAARAVDRPRTTSRRPSRPSACSRRHRRCCSASRTRSGANTTSNAWCRADSGPLR